MTEPPEAVHPRPNEAENESDNEREATELQNIAEQHPPRHVTTTTTTTPGRPQQCYLGYLRTPLALSMVGVVISQLYRLQHSPSLNPVYGYYVLGNPIACIFHASALVVILVGAVRFSRQQSAMSIGKVHAGGWEVLVICGWVFLVSVITTGALHEGENR
ncbi:hypothetical protein D0867_12484 [Hortaea werneckii]|uniref:DUF202 domain-containing protein n=1 Tax=Hortaea werneckii TaxID=91943 RepID=A0A3M6Y6C6_HORWE|nr:hypothetical protein D0867_12484 [Hortaea werneckii]